MYERTCNMILLICRWILETPNSLVFFTIETIIFQNNNLFLIFQTTSIKNRICLGKRNYICLRYSYVISQRDCWFGFLLWHRCTSTCKLCNTIFNYKVHSLYFRYLVEFLFDCLREVFDPSGSKTDNDVLIIELWLYTRT